MNNPPKTILLVEDEAIISLSESKKLKEVGYSVVPARNGEEAIELFQKSPETFDLILMDIDLGKGIDGTQAAGEILRAYNVPVLFLSSHMEPDIVERTEKITNYGYVVKSSVFTVLDASIKMAFKLFEAQKKLIQKNMEIEAGNERLRVTIEELQVTGEELETANRNLIESEREITLQSKKLSESEARLTRAETLAKTGNWEYHVGTDLVTASKGAMKIYGFPTDQIRLSDIRDVRLPEYRPFLEEGLRSLKEDGIAYDYYFKIKQLGTGSILDIHSIAEYDPDAKIVFGVIQDITSQKKIDEESQREHVILQTLIDNLPDPVYFIDTEGRKIIANRADINNIGLKDKEEVLGKTDLELYPGDVGVRGHADTMAVIQSGEPIVNREEDFYRLDGERHWLLTSKIPVRDQQGAVIGLVGIGHDNTEQRKIEQTLRRNADQTSMLMKELEHRVKNSLGVVSSLLNLELAALRDESAQKVFRATISRIDSISSVYERLYLSDDLVTVDMRRYIENLADSIFGTMVVDSRFLRVRSTLTDLRLDAAHAVPVGLILNEMMTNALKYAYPPETEGEIRVSLESKGDAVTLSVTDDGVGLPKTVDPKTSTSTGMLIMNMLAKQLQGEVQFESARGTKASVSFESVTNLGGAIGEDDWTRMRD